jgi:hypothetical protein
MGFAEKFVAVNEPHFLGAGTKKKRNSISPFLSVFPPSLLRSTGIMTGAF